MFNSNSLSAILQSLRSAYDEAGYKNEELSNLRDEIESAIEDVSEYRDGLSDAISSLEAIGDLSVSASFTESLEDFDLSPDI